jgi:prepilin-type N-terminal cleavage/methylation domain-containing protein
MNRPGMTLLEVLVGLTVASVALALGFGALTALSDNGDRARMAAEAAITDAAKRAVLSDWLTQARLRPDGGGEFRGIDGVLEDHGDARLTFATTAATVLGLHETRVELFIDRDETTPERGLVVNLSDDRGAMQHRVVLAEGATGLSARYLSGIPGDERWLPSWISSTVLPRAIELRLEAQHADSLPLLLRRPLRVPVGSTQ